MSDHAAARLSKGLAVKTVQHENVVSDLSQAWTLEGMLRARIAELENAIAQHKLKQWGGEGVEVSSAADAALYAHLQN